MEQPKNAQAAAATRAIGALLARYLPAVLLTAVALSQIYLARVDGLLVPSKGGAFGMFATIDKYEHRVVRFYAIAPGGHERALKPDDLVIARPSYKRAAPRARSFPTPGHLRTLARVVARHNTFTEPTQGVRVEVWKVDFDRPTRLARRAKLAEIAVPIRRPGRGAG